MNIISSFTSNGVPATGLSPTIRVRDVSTGNLLVTDDSMIEVGDGWYKYDFTGYDANVDYAIVCDGGNTLPNNERYTFTGNDSFKDDIQSGLAKDIDLKRALGLMHENIFIDNPVYDTDNNLIGARVRIYSDGVSVGTESNVIGVYEISSNGTAPGKFSDWKQVRQL